MRLTSNDDYSAVLLIHTLEEQKHQQPMAEIVRREGDVDAFVVIVIIQHLDPLLLAKVLEARIQHERPDGWDVARRDPCVDGCCCVTDAALRGQVEGEDLVGVREVPSSGRCRGGIRVRG